MVRNAMPVVLTAALFALAISPACAQKASATARTASTGPSTTATRSDIVGSVNGKAMSWTVFIQRFQKENPTVFDQVVAASIGPKVATGLFGPIPRASMTVTRAEALASLKTDSNPTLANVLQNMLTEDAIHQEAARDGVVVTDADAEKSLDTALKSARAAGQIPQGVTDNQFLAERHLSRSSLVATFRTREMIPQLVKKDLERSLGHPIGPGDFVEARHILIIPKPDTAAPGAKTPDTNGARKGDAEALAKITQIREDILAKKTTFADAAKQYSDDPGSKEKSGELGVVVRGSMVKEFDTVAFTLQPGAISQPVKTEFGYHIIEVEKLGKDLSPEERDQALSRYEQQRSQQYMSDLLSNRAKIVNNLRPPTPAGPNMMPPGAGPAMRGGIRPPQGAVRQQ